MAQSRRRHNLNQIKRYILLGEAAHPLSRQEAQVRAEGKRQKGRSLTPWSGKFERLLANDDYAHARRRIEPALNYLRIYRRRYWFILRHAGENPSEVTRWEAEGTTHDKSWHRAFKGALRELEAEVERRHPSEKMYVPASPDEQPSEEPITVEGTYLEIAALVYKLMSKEYSKTAAVHEIAESEECSVSKVWRALDHASQNQKSTA